MVIDSRKYTDLISAFDKQIRGTRLTRFNDNFNGSVSLYWKSLCDMAKSPYSIVPAKVRVTTYSDDSLVIMVHRKGEGVLFPDFQYRVSVNGLSETSYVEVETFLQSVAIKLYKEAVLFTSLSELNNIYGELSNSFRIQFTTDLFSSSKVISFDDTSMVLVADTSRLLFVGDVPGGIKGYLEAEKNVLASCTTTAEVLARRPQLLSTLLDPGRLGVFKLIKPAFNKTIKQLKAYPTVLDKGYYQSGSIFGAVERTETGVVVIVEPFNTATLLKVNDVDLLKMLEVE